VADACAAEDVLRLQQPSLRKRSRSRSSRKPPAEDQKVSSTVAGHKDGDLDAIQTSLSNILASVNELQKRVAKIEQGRVGKIEATEGLAAMEDDEDAGAPETTDKLNNMFAYTLDLAINGAETGSTRDVVVATLFSLFLNGLQIIFTYGLYDAATLGKLVDDSATFTYPGLSHAWYYLDINLDFGDRVPLMIFLASICSMVIFCFSLKSDNEGTLLAPTPLEQLVLPLTAELAKAPTLGNAIDGVMGISGKLTDISETFTADNVKAEALKRKRQGLLVFVGIVFQSIWCIRACIIPGMALIGSAFIFASSASAVDVVLNAVAVGFIFELDEFLYEQLLPFSKRQEYEARQRVKAHPTSPLAVPGGLKVVKYASSMIYIVDLCVGIVAYLVGSDVDLGIDLGIRGEMVYRIHVTIRISFLALAEMYTAYTARSNTSRRTALMLTIALYGLLIIGCALIVFILLIVSLQFCLGWREGYPEAIAALSADMAACRTMNEVIPKFASPVFYEAPRCMMLHVEPRYFEELGNNTLYDYMKTRFQDSIWTSDCFLQTMFVVLGWENEHHAVCLATSVTGHERFVQTSAGEGTGGISMTLESKYPWANTVAAAAAAGIVVDVE